MTEDDPYAKWQMLPGPDTLNEVMESLRPTINSALGRINAADDNTVRMKARALTVSAIKSFDPSSGASLRTHVTNQLQPLSRYRRKVQSVGIPERTQLDAYTIYKGELELEDKLGRKPDVTELSDFIRMPVKRIAAVRRQSGRKAVSESNAPDSENKFDFADEAAEYLAPTLDRFGRAVLEGRTGFGGNPIVDVRTLAAQTGTSPAKVSRKAAELAASLQEIQSALEGLY